MFSRPIFRPRAARAWRLLLPLCGIAVGASGADNGSLLAAVKDGNAASLRSLLAERADPNEADADGTSVLHWAVHQGEIESVATLLAAGAAVDAANRYGVRPSYLAAENGDAAMMSALLEAGADPNARVRRGRDRAHDGRAHRRCRDARGVDRGRRRRQRDGSARRSNRSHVGGRREQRAGDHGTVERGSRARRARRDRRVHGADIRGPGRRRRFRQGVARCGSRCECRRCSTARACSCSR